MQTKHRMIRNFSPLLSGRRRGKSIPAFLWLGMLALLLLSGATSAIAQVSTSASVRGTVKDPNGAVVAKATVVLISERTQSERKTNTSSDGAYAFTAVDP
ncbi:MAG TPA: carboxypeptidase-like regulatory domain-containing protein, partial [Blastocatellia bacterium]|nr:carboxypeptidase-like regulatory domain-containing protein [Blastocatellia bacterium]